MSMNTKQPLHKRTLLSLAVAGVLASATSHGAETGKYLHFDFEQVNGDQILDVSGNGYDATSRNTPVLQVGQVGQALRFDGASDRVSMAVANFPKREFTVALWVKDERGDGRGSLFNFKTAGWNKRIVSITGMGDLAVHIGDTFIKTGIRLGDGQWHHLAVSWTRRNGLLRVYKDGTLAFVAQDVNRAQDLESSGALALGVEPNKWNIDWGYAFGGLLDEVQVFNRMLSDAEIAAMAAQSPLDDQAAPQAPDTLQVVAVSPTETYVSWSGASDDTGVAGYRLYRDGQLIAVTGDTRFIDRGLTPGAVVEYTVAAFDMADKPSALSAPVQVSMPAGGSVLDVLPPGHWYEVVDSSIEADLGKTPKVMKPWSSGAYDTRRERLVIFGGGHLDYSGNELYAFDVNTLQWLQLTQPSAPEDISKTDPIYADGRPSAVHTYDGLEYLPNVDRLFTSGGSIYGTGGCSGNTWLFDFDAQPAEDGWQHIADSRGGCGMISAYDSGTGRVWYAAGSELLEFDPLNLDAPWTRHPGVFTDSFKFYMTAAMDPGRRKLAALGGTGYGGYPRVQVVDLAASPIPRAEVLATSGATEIEDSDAAGFVFDPVSDRFIAWNGGGSVYALDVDAKLWTRLDPKATNAIIPSAPEKNGTYGRFRYIPSKNAFILVNSVETGVGNVFFYKLSDAPGVALPYPQADFSADTTRITAGESVTLSWTATDADRCEAQGGWSGIKALSGEEQIGPLDSDTRFVLVCSSDAGDAIRSVLVQVDPVAGSEGGNDASTNEPVTPDPVPPVVDNGGQSSGGDNGESPSSTNPVDDTVVRGGDASVAAGDALGAGEDTGLAQLNGEAQNAGGDEPKMVVVTAASGPLALLTLVVAGWLGRRRSRG